MTWKAASDEHPRNMSVIARSLLGATPPATSRRGLLALAGGLLAASLGLAESEAAKKAKNKKKRKRRKNRKDTPEPTPQPTPEPTPEPSPETRVDAECPGPTDNSGLSVDDGDRVAQTFTALTTGRLVGAELLIFASSTGSADLTLQLRDIDASGVPTNVVLGEASLLSSAVPAGETTVAFSFLETPSVAASREYALVLSKRGPRIVSWKGHRTSACDGRAFERESGAGAFDPQVADLDLIFSTLVRA